MIRWISAPGRLEGFSFWPFWEVSVGWLLMVAAVVVPVLFVVYNGFNPKQVAEWLFCLGFLVFFLWMGSVLAFQNFSARLADGALHIDHNLREPPTRITLPLADWRGTSTAGEGEERGRKMAILSLTTAAGEREVYRTVDLAEAKALARALEALRQNKP